MGAGGWVDTGAALVTETAGAGDIFAGGGFETEAAGVDPALAGAFGEDPGVFGEDSLAGVFGEDSLAGTFGEDPGGDPALACPETGPGALFRMSGFRSRFKLKVFTEFAALATWYPGFAKIVGLA